KHVAVGKVVRRRHATQESHLAHQILEITATGQVNALPIRIVPNSPGGRPPWTPRDSPGDDPPGPPATVRADDPPGPPAIVRGTTSWTPRAALRLTAHPPQACFWSTRRAALLARTAARAGAITGGGV